MISMCPGYSYPPSQVLITLFFNARIFKNFHIHLLFYDSPFFSLMRFCCPNLFDDLYKVIF